MGSHQAATIPFFSHGCASYPGRKHVFASGASINEDLVSSFTFALPGSVLPFIHTAVDNSNANPGHSRQEGWPLVEEALVFFVADGHGESSRPSGVQFDSPDSSPSEIFQTLVRELLPMCVEKLFVMGVEKALEHLKPGGSDDYFRVIEAVSESFEQLNDTLTDAIAGRNRKICLENGSTLVLCLVWHSTVWCCNIGDSAIMIADSSSGDPLKVWKRPEDDDFHFCSYEDTLGRFPYAVREGQTHRSVKSDLATLTQMAKASFKANPPASGSAWRVGTHLEASTPQTVGPNNGTIRSPNSAFKLGMTNTIGNLNHDGFIFRRTTVYCFDIVNLLEKTHASSLVFALLSDGIKDLLTTNQICCTINNLRSAVAKLTTEKQESSTQLSISHIKWPRSRRQDRHDVCSTEHLKLLLSCPPDLTEQETTGGVKGPPLAVEAGLDLDLSDGSAHKEYETLPRSVASATQKEFCRTALPVAAASLCNFAVLRGAVDDVTACLVEVCAAVPEVELPGNESQEGSLKLCWDLQKRHWAWRKPRLSAKFDDGPIPSRQPIVLERTARILRAVAAHIREKGGERNPTD
ncbi:hypothetical protein DFJ73DRAFT_839712 [Zopfochytrium polystomum]|nr:hypothetical protein DFJ73DRAFT_839712 [Zopfochytrium polystomum]